MGFDSGRISLDSPNSTYYSGQTVFGKLEFQQEKQKKFRGIYIIGRGFADVHWTTDHTRKVRDRTEHYKEHHNAHEEYFSYKHYLVGSEHGEYTMQPGHQSFPFQFHIPPHCPSSFEGRYGHIRYEIKIVVNKPFKLDQEKKMDFRVVTPVDLNQCPESKNPLAIEFSDSFCCWCMRAGEVDTLVKLPVSGYVPGQVIPIEVRCENKGNVDIASIKLILRKKITYHAHSEAGTKHDETILSKITKGVVKGNSTKEWMVDMEVPIVDAFNVDTCRIIDIDYDFKVKVCPSGCHSSTTQSRKIKIGTVPIQGIENKGPNPLETPMPVPQVVPDNQNAPSFYPGQNNPYGANPPYPGANPPIADLNPPYPGDIPPYPGANPPYPGANPPYPGANPPYPGANPPYPGANPPYPGANPPNPPYPGTNLPYPGVNPPYPGANLPYPGANPPFSAPSVPYPTSPGFKIDGMQNSAPQMPIPGGNHNTSNPWSQPTAPEPSTPITEVPPSEKPLLAPIGPSSPYNPQFMK